LRGQQKALIAAVAVLLCAFAAVAVSVVDARRPLDRNVVRSFQAALSQLSKSRADVTCTKTRVDFYDCESTSDPRPGRGRVTLEHTLWLTDDGCWKAYRREPVPPPSDLGRLATSSALIRGWVADAGT
jgi:hypothetical protein